MMLHVVGARLGKTVAELGDLTVDEFTDWIAFFEIEAEERER